MDSIIHSLFFSHKAILLSLIFLSRRNFGILKNLNTNLSLKPCLLYTMPPYPTHAKIASVGAIKLRATIKDFPYITH
jgi:hypothetical protein